MRVWIPTTNMSKVIALFFGHIGPLYAYRIEDSNFTRSGILVSDRMLECYGTQEII